MANPVIAARIDLEQLSANARAVIELTKKPLMAVVKADAYGHGLVPGAHAAVRGGATWLGTAFIDEAIQLRDGGITEPILAWLTPPTADFVKALEFTIDLSISSLEQLTAIVAASEQTGVKPRVHLKVDTGMSRAGALDEFPALVSAIGELLDEDQIELVGTWSHLACADDPHHPLTQNQGERFQSALDYLANEGIDPGIRHIANSAAVLHHPHLYFDMVRAGLLLYGYVPGGSANSQNNSRINIKPVMELSADVALVKRVPAGSSIGYGATIRLTEDRYIGLIPLGYADGVPRSVGDVTGPNAPHAIACTIAGQRYPLIGRISMDQVTVDLGVSTSVKAGDRAVFFGSADSLTADDWALAAGTISYEILSRIGARVPRLAR